MPLWKYVLITIIGKFIFIGFTLIAKHKLLTALEILKC